MRTAAQGAAASGACLILANEFFVCQLAPFVLGVSLRMSLVYLCVNIGILWVPSTGGTGFRIDRDRESGEL